MSSQFYLGHWPGGGVITRRKTRRVGEFLNGERELQYHVRVPALTYIFHNEMYAMNSQALLGNTKATWAYPVFPAAHDQKG